KRFEMEPNRVSVHPDGAGKIINGLRFPRPSQRLEHLLSSSHFSLHAYSLSKNSLEYFHWRNLMELDLRPLPRVEWHAALTGAFRELARGGVLLLVSDIDPAHLHEQFDVDQSRSYTWTYEERGPKVWRIRLTKTAETPLPRVLANVRDVSTAALDFDRAGAVWNLAPAPRDLDSNLIALAPGTRIDSHVGPDLDVMFVIIDGSGRLTTEIDTVDIVAGDVVWLPRRSIREIVA